MITVQNSDSREIITFPTYEIPSKIRTPWIKGTNNRPYSVVLDMGGVKYHLTLVETVNKDSKRVLTAFDTINGVHVKVIFSFGTDPARPSYAGTISFKHAKKARA